jgi:hypothetical protein
MKKLMNIKVGIALLAATVAVVASVVGYAYFTNSGSGTGNAGVGTSTAITLSSGAVSGLLPGGPAVPVTVTVTNPGAGSQYVDTISGLVTTQAGCLGTWFTVAPITYQQTLLAGASSAPLATTITMIDSLTNQDVCKSLTMVINWSSN